MKYEPERKALIGSIVLNPILGGAVFSLWFDDSSGKEVSTASGVPSEPSVSRIGGTALGNQAEKDAGFDMVERFTPTTGPLTSRTFGRRSCPKRR